MSRVSQAYIGFAIALIIGLWAILSFGSLYARAPRDMAGQWKIANAGNMKVEQSGRFFVLTFDDGKPVNVVLKKEQTDARGHAQMSLAGGPWNVTITSQGSGGDFDFDIQGPSPRTFRARRVERMYQSISESTTPATPHASQR